MSPIRRLVPRFSHPAQVIVAAFAAVVALGTGLLLLPVARTTDNGADLVTALFTATSAVCVTGLTVVDTASYWSPTGQVIILALCQVGGFGIMALATLLGLLVSRRMGLRMRLITAAETRALGIGDVRRVLWGIARTMLLFELAGVALLLPAFWLRHDETLGQAAWLAVFHAVSAFNNAGFSLFSDSLSGFATDPLISFPVAGLVVAGSLGFPVLFELRREWRQPRGWTLHTKVVLSTSAALVAVGTVGFLVLEWASSLGRMSVPGKLVAAFFQGVQPRSGGFNSVDTAALDHETWLFTDLLMFIGGGPGSTAGGIKVTTFAVLLFVIMAEVRGDEDVNAFGRRLSQQTQRQALALALIAVVVVAGATGVMLLLTDLSLDRALFDVISASATVGLSTGAAAEAGSGGQLLLAALMFLGRLGPVTFASALALRRRPRLYRLPSERPIIG